MTEEKKTETKKEVKKEYTLEEIPTGKALVIAYGDEILTEQEVLVTILNKLDKIEKKI